MRISDWSSDVCSSDLSRARPRLLHAEMVQPRLSGGHIDRLLVSAEADRPARIAYGAPPCRRHDLLRDAGPHHRRAAGLCLLLPEIGRASSRARVVQYGLISVVAVSLKKKKK